MTWRAVSARLYSLEERRALALEQRGRSVRGASFLAAGAAAARPGAGPGAAAAGMQQFGSRAAGPGSKTTSKVGRCRLTL
jgi:hypothetical protein